jgi:TalC/MipB family fructose-6-phosphate aldolase
MELWLDTIDRMTIGRAKNLGLLHGVTTNPTILSQSSEPVEEVLEDLLNCFSGPLAVQVTLRSVEEMIDQGKDLFDFSSRIIVKIPVTEEGIEAIYRLSHSEIPVMATAIFAPMQAFIAAKAGARYLAPYFSYLGEKALGCCLTMHKIACSNNRPCKLLVAALKTPEEATACIESGFSAMTLKPDLFQQCLLPAAQTLEHLDRFDADWKNAAPSKLLSAPQFIR